MSIFERNPWRNIRTGIAYDLNEYSSSDTLSRPIVESVVRTPRIYTVCRRYEVFCVPVCRKQNC